MPKTTTHIAAMTPDNDGRLQRLALSQMQGINIRTWRMLLEKTGDAATLFNYPTDEIRQATGLKSGHWNDEVRTRLLEAARNEAAFMDRSGVGSLCVDSDAGYPMRLAQCDDAPALIYTLGRCDLNAPHLVAVVGTRHATAAGSEFAARLIEDLAARIEGLVVVSGLAYGIDIAAHKAALKAGVPTVGVLAHPLNTLYPAEHRDYARRIVNGDGMLITEYSTNRPIHRGNFLARNRIVAGLCDVTVVVESDERGGAMSTARCARSYDREVCAVPGRVSDRYSRGCNMLIANNTAQLITCADDLIAFMGWKTRPTEGTQQTLALTLSADEQTVYDAIETDPTQTVNELCMATAMPYSRITGILFQLEMAGHIVSVPGNRFAIVSR